MPKDGAQPKRATLATVDGHSPHLVSKSLQANLSGETRRRDDVQNFRSRAIQRVTTFDKIVPVFLRSQVHTDSAICGHYVLLDAFKSGIITDSQIKWKRNDPRIQHNFSASVGCAPAW